MDTTTSIVLTVGFIVILYVIAKFIEKLLSKRKPQKRKKLVLPPTIKSKADRKFKMLLFKFKRKHKRKPNKNDLFRIVITASHHTYPVKGRNSRRWMRGKSGHWKRQKVRKYLLEKHKVVDNFKMK